MERACACEKERVEEKLSLYDDSSALHRLSLETILCSGSRANISREDQARNLRLGRQRVQHAHAIWWARYPHHAYAPTPSVRKNRERANLSGREKEGEREYLAVNTTAACGPHMAFWESMPPIIADHPRGLIVASRAAWARVSNEQILIIRYHVACALWPSNVAALPCRLLT
ncbi:hypothetical protein MRB53_003421 [Persea americana]|uniref:Uncharacterized protein n=1 Tax=Persea americana TaxID=3435 RepID=A0ACC2MY70_PERAE|nr:hypothetical protein MRB53_003421 [Persea americana]